MFEIKQVGKFEAHLIKKYKVPYGLYWIFDIDEGEGVFHAIDNTTGEAIIETFYDMESMMDWFEHKLEKEDFETWKQKMMAKK